MIILNWIKEPKNAILIGIVLAFLSLFAHDRYLKNVINKRDNEIIILNTNINNLKSSIELQNQAIKNMNNDFEKQNKDFYSEYESVQKSNINKKQRIEKQEKYVTPESVKTDADKVNQAKNVYREYIKSRRGVQ